MVEEFILYRFIHQGERPCACGVVRDGAKWSGPISVSCVIEASQPFGAEILRLAVHARELVNRIAALETENAALREGLKAGEFDAVLSDYLAWSLRQFPGSTPASVAAHIRKEAAELAAEPTSAEELADIVALAFHSAARQGFDLTGTLAAKLPVLKARTWGEPDADGVVEHVK